MNSLPPEILHNIFTRLDFQQRVECLTVCGHWQRVLDRFCLFYSVQLDESKAHFKKFMDLFESSPRYAAHVEELQFVYNTFNIEKLVAIFPNARAIKVAHSYSRPFFSGYIPFRDTLATTSLTSKVESLSDVFYCKLALQLTSSNLCGRLETLDLYQFDTHDHAIHRLKNLPVLKTLKLNVYQISIGDIEVLHKNIPSVQDFVFVAQEIQPNQEASDIAPIASLETIVVKVTRFTNLETHVRFYQYMTKKYANVLDIKCFDIILHYYDADKRRQIYSQAILDFIRLPGLTKRGMFTLHDFPDGFNVFEILDSVGAQISDLYIDKCQRKTLYKYLYESNQLEYIQKLKLESTDVETMDFIKSIPSLHTLNLSFSNTYMERLPYPMNAVRDLCPDRVKHLTINIYSLRQSGYVNQLQYIQNLDIRCSNLTQDLANIIELYFPNLTKLSVRASNLSENVDIVLKSRSLQEATFHVDATQGDEYGVQFTSPNQAEMECYRCRPRVNTVVCSSLKEMKRLRCRLSIVSETDKKLIIGGFTDAAFKLINI